MVSKPKPSVTTPSVVVSGARQATQELCAKCHVNPRMTHKIFCEQCMGKILNVSFTAPTVNVTKTVKAKTAVPIVHKNPTKVPETIHKSADLRSEQLKVLLNDDKVNIARYGNILEKYIKQLKEAQLSFMKHLDELKGLGN